MADSNILSIFPSLEAAYDEGSALFDAFLAENRAVVEDSLRKLGASDELVGTLMAQPQFLKSAGVQGFLQGIIYAETYQLSIAKGLTNGRIDAYAALVTAVNTYQSVYRLDRE